MGWFPFVAGAALLVAVLVQWQRGSPSAGALTTAQTRRLVSDLLQEQDLHRRATAATSVLYLANVEKLRPQLRREGVLGALVAVVLQSDPRPPPPHSTPPPPSPPAPPSSAPPLSASPSSDALTACLLGIAKLCAGDPASQALLLNNGVLDKAMELFRASGSARYMAAASQLLYSLSRGAAQAREAVHMAVGDEAAELADVGYRMLEGGAHGNSSDAMVSANHLLSVLLGSGAPSTVGPTLGLLKERDAPHLLMQVLATHHARNGSAEVVGSVAEVLEALVKEDGSLLARLGEAGTLQQLLQELRPPRILSALPVLRLLGLAANTEAGAERLISGGLLSMCTQLYFHAEAALAWRQVCMDLVCDLTEAPRFSMPARDEAPSGPEHTAHAARVLGPRHLVRALLAVFDMRVLPGVHVSALQALRDVADVPHVAHAIAHKKGLKALVSLLSRDLPAEGLYPAVWQVQTQRAAVTLLAVLSLHQELRQELVQEGVVEALCRLLLSYPEAGGPPQQIRVTAAAALVPLLEAHARSGDEVGRSQVVRRAVDAGVMDALLPMVKSTNAQEKAVAARVVALLTRDAELEGMVEEEEERQLRQQRTQQQGQQQQQRRQEQGHQGPG